MTRSKKISLWATAFFVLCALLIFILILSSDKLINQKQVLDKIQSNVSEAINGQITFQQIHVSFFPRPQIVVQQCRFSIPETIKGTVKSLAISPKLLPLIMGKFHNSKITLNTPDIEINIKRKPESEDKYPNSFSFGTAEEKAGAVLAAVFSKTPGLTIRFKNASLNILKDKKPAFWLKDTDASITVLKDHINLDMSCSASFCENISLKGAANLSKDKMSFSIANLKLGFPRLNLSGKLDIHRSPPSMSPKVNLELTAKDVDVSSTRKALLDMAGENPVVNELFSIVKGGEISLIEWTSHGKSIQELGELNHITLKSNITGGKIFVPEVDLNLTDVEGDVTILKGILNGKNLKAHMGASKCLDGTLKLGLTGKNAPFHLDLALEADLSQLQPILKRVVHNEAFIKENSLVDNVNGNAKGRLILGESLDSIQCRVDVSQFNLTANYKRFPRPIKINSGQYFLEGKSVSVKKVNGSMGNSEFSEFYGQVEWETSPRLTIESGKAKMDLKEIYPWLLSSNIISGKLRDLKNIQGMLALSSMRLNGPFLEPKSYQFQLEGQAKQLKFDSPLLPGSFEAIKGKFVITSKDISITDIQSRIQNTSLKISGTFKDYPNNLNSADITFQGEIGPVVTRWVEDTFKISKPFRLRPPISVSTAHLTWKNQQQLAFSGDLSLKKDIKITTRFSVNPEKLTIEKLIIQDQNSNASIKLGRKNRIMDVLFVGNLQHTTLDNVLEKNESLKGQIKGNVFAHVLLDHPLNSTLEGKLNAKNIVCIRKSKSPLIINDLSLATKKDVLHIESAGLALEENAFNLKGNVNLSASSPKLDMKLYADRLNLDQLEKDLKGNTGQNRHQTDEKSWAYPMRGMVKATIKKLTFDGFTFRPFEADIRLNGRSAMASITDANVCGISTLGTVEIAPPDIIIDLKPSAQNQELNESIQCLSDKSEKIVGDFNLEGNIKAKGTGQTLMKHINGDLKFYASKGRIDAGRNFKILIKIFSILNVTDIFKGKLSNPETNGFAFNSIHANADLKNGKLMLNEMIIDGTSMNIVCQGYIDLVNKRMDVTALAAPLKTVDFFVKRTPIIKDILGDSLVSIPVGIKGNLDYPSVIPLPPSKVGSGLLGIVKRTLQLPVKIIQPIPQEGKPF